MTDNLFDNAKFGDMFLTTENKQAVFLRFSENAEYEFAILYVEDWGNVQVFRHNGKEIYNDAAHSIVSKKEEPVSEQNLSNVEKTVKNWKEPVSEELESEIQRYYVDWDEHPEYVQTARHFAKWQKEQMMAKAVDGEVTHGKSLAIPSLGYRLDKEGFDFGDKVKVLVVKED